MRAATDGQVKQVRALRRRGLSLVEIAARTALSKSAVGRATADMKTDARARANRQRAAADHAALPWLAEARRLLAGGLTRNRIAARLGVPKTVIYRHL